MTTSWESDRRLKTSQLRGFCILKGAKHRGIRQRRTADPAVLFTTYDELGRPVQQGQVNSSLWPSLKGDSTYSTGTGSFENFDADTSKMIVQNMFDRKQLIGAFKVMPFSINLNFLKNTKGRLLALAYRDKPGAVWGYKLYSYDALGRVERFYHKFPRSNQFLITFNEYDHAGNLVKQNVDNSMYYWYSYDHEGKLLEVLSSMVDNKTIAVPDARYYYNKASQIDSLVYPYARGKKISYTYNNYRGWVENISMNGIFSESLTYALPEVGIPLSVIDAFYPGGLIQLGNNLKSEFIKYNPSPLINAVQTRGFSLYVK